MSELSFSPASSEDTPILLDILTDATHQKLNRGDMSWGPSGWTEEEVRDVMTESTVYLVRQNDQIIGTVSLQWDDEEVWGPQPPVAGYLHRLAIKDEFRGQGLGEQIVDWSAARAAENGRSSLRLDCEESNEDLCNYYKGLGFTKVGSQILNEFYTAALFERPTNIDN